MAKRKVVATCKGCGSSEALYVTLRNGDRLPSYTYAIGKGIICNGCKAKEVA